MLEIHIYICGGRLERTLIKNFKEKSKIVLPGFHDSGFAYTFSCVFSVRVFETFFVDIPIHVA